MRLITLLLFAFSFLCLNAQDCPPGSVTITSQAEMDNFATTYPNCTQINGNLTLNGAYDYTSIFPNLPALKTITGSLGFYANSSASGFPNLEYVGGISDSHGTGGTFPMLDTIGGGIWMSEPYGGVGFPSCPQLKYIGGSIQVVSSEGGRINSNHFPNVEYIGGDIRDYSDWANSDFSGFSNLRYLGGNINIEEGSIGGFNALDTIGGDLIFRKSEAVSAVYIKIAGLNQLKYIGGNFNLLGYENVCVEHLDGLSQLNYIGGNFDVYWQYDGSGGGDGCTYGVTNLDGLPALKHVGGKLRIGESDLVDIDFLTALESVGGNLEITYNDLENIEGLNHAIDIGGELMIEGNPDLSECAVQSVCNHINSSGTTTIADNMAGCDNLQQVEASCNVDCSGDLILTTQQEIDDFMIDYSGCFHIEGNLIINGTTPDEISNLNGLSEVISISDTLFIIENQMLTDISGLANINYSSLKHIQISGNSILSSCSIASVCRFIANSGTNSIYSNNEDCNSETEIRDNCVICPSSYLFLESQDEVDEYRILYPGCTDVPEIIIVTGDDIDNLNGLIEIERMEKSLRIESCPALIDLSGLDNLESVFSLTIEYNYALSNIQALSNLRAIHSTFRLINDVPLTGLENLQRMGTLNMLGNSSVTDFTVLSSLDSLGNLDLYNNNNLVSMDGLQNLTHLQHVDISKHDNLISLEGLNNVVSVKNFIVGDNSALQSFEGLNSLTYVTNDMNIGDYGGGNYGAAFQTLSGLDNLTTIDGDLIVAGTSQLSNLEGLNNLTSLGERLIIYGNSGLNNLVGLENLTAVGSHLIMKYNGLTSLEGLNNLQTINGDLIIGEDTTGPGGAGNALENINALSSLTSINGKLSIVENDNLATINNLPNLDYSTITYLEIRYNLILTTCDAPFICDYLNAGGSAGISTNANGCNNLTQVETACAPMLICPSGDITLTTQQEIDAFATTYPQCTQLPGRLTISATNPADINSLEALSQLTSLGNGLIIDNTAITNLSGLQNLTTTGYNIVITNNSNLTSLEGLENISATLSHLKIENNDALTDLSGLNNITQIGESLLIFDNDNLQNLFGLNALTSIGSQLYLKNNTNLSSLSGLENLNSIGTDIRIQVHPSLSSLSALSNVANISGYIQLTNNDALTSLMGLENINADGITQLTISNNPNLSMCSASSICGHIEDNGMTTFSNNAAGCNSLSEVTDICTVSTHSPDDAPDIAISPNPNDGTFTLQGTIRGTYNILNFTGQTIQTGELKNETSIDISSEAQGVYFISISIDNQVITKRIVKM